MKGFVRKGAALVLLAASLAVSGLCPVQAQGNPIMPGNNPGAGYSVESSSVISGNSLDAGYST